MATHTFPCPFCGRRMGVGADLLGRKVRCPHCKQVIQAPAGPAPPPPEPEFKRPAKETAESILSDPGESDDEVFSSSQGQRLKVPPLPEPPTPRPPAADDPFAFDPSPTPAAAPRAAAGGKPASPPPEPLDPFAEFAQPVAPPVAPPPPPRPAPVVAIPLPAPQPAADANPFAFAVDEPAAEPAREPARVVEAELAPDEPEPEAPRRTRHPAADPAGPWKIAVYVLAAYALLMTGLAIYGLTRSTHHEPGAQPTPAKKK